MADRGIRWQGMGGGGAQDMVKYLAIGVLAAVAGCRALPEARSYELPEHPTAAEHAPLTVPHRDWLAQGCWFRSENGRDVKVCK